MFWLDDGGGSDLVAEKAKRGETGTCQQGDDTKDRTEDLTFARAPNRLLGHGSTYEAVQTSASFREG